MEFLADLWLPILLSAVCVFIVSSIIHMATPMHKSDYRKLPEEDATLDSLRHVGRGEYAFPWVTCMGDMASAEVQEKYKRGPVGFMIVLPSGVPGIGKSLLQWFLFSILIAVFVAYITHLARPYGSDFGSVLQVAGATGVLGHAFGNTSNSIWKGASWWTTTKFTIDGILYGLVTGLTFAWLWPALG